MAVVLPEPAPTEEVLAVAQRLQASDSRAARWVCSDALRELTSAKITERVARREGTQQAEH